jgi:hypothetical protein
MKDALVTGMERLAKREVVALISRRKLEDAG